MLAFAVGVLCQRGVRFDRTASWRSCISSWLSIPEHFIRGEFPKGRVGTTPNKGVLSMFKPIIGLNADFANASGDKPSFTYVASGYYDAISKVGGIPVIIPPVAEDDDLEQLLDRLNGVVLVGGADLDPRRDGYMLHPTIRPLAT